MKYILSICLVLFGLTTLHAQEPDTTKPKKKIEEKIQSGSRDRIIVELNFINWAQLDGKQVQTKWYSRGYNFYFMYDIILGKSRFSVAPGLGFGIDNAFLEQSLFQDTASTSFVPFDQNPNLPASNDYKKYKLNTVHLDIPLELRFRSKPNARNKSFKMAIGFKGGVVIDNHTKLKYEDVRGKPHVLKEKNYQDLMRFRYGPTFRIGYGAFNVVGYYSLGELFKGAGPGGIHPFAVGISINGL